MLICICIYCDNNTKMDLLSHYEPFEYHNYDNDNDIDENIMMLQKELSQTSQDDIDYFISNVKTAYNSSKNKASHSVPEAINKVSNPKKRACRLVRESIQKVSNPKKRACHLVRETMNKVSNPKKQKLNTYKIKKEESYFKCQFCPKQFKKSNELITHCSKLHKINEDFLNNESSNNESISIKKHKSEINKRSRIIKNIQDENFQLKIKTNQLEERIKNLTSYPTNTSFQSNIHLQNLQKLYRNKNGIVNPA